jgi:2-C-methyl-D-erythritol 4-phosphate cytidylyltransferase/2-C-methyl-D-erythritol 2,4-cyclodiphosphate synthase
MPNQPAIGVIIVAAGSGERFGGDIPKQWKPLVGLTAVERSWLSFMRGSLVKLGQFQTPSWVCIVVDENHTSAANALNESRSVASTVVTGGPSRRQSVANALKVMPDDIEIVGIHDAVRPFWPQSKWDELVDACHGDDGAILAVPVSDTLKNDSGSQTVTVDRRNLWMAQTPQVFRAPVLREAHRQAELRGIDATDDADLVERAGGRVTIIPSTTTNIKITTPDDWNLALRIAGMTVSSAAMRVGTGYDTHRLGGDGPLVIGGVRFADHGGLIGHSDGDALLHAICDALLGAAALGDIGQHFPPSDSRLAGIDSRHLVRETVSLLKRAGYRPVQVDATVLAERPKIMPQAEAIRKIIAEDLGIGPAMVSVKATTNEQMGFIGRGEGIAAQAIAVIAPL